MPAPNVTAVVVNWNGVDCIGPCLETLLASDYDNLSVIVVDNASTDGSPELVRGRFPGVRLIETGVNDGYAAGANVGLAAAADDEADFAFVLNNDVEFDRGCVSALVRAAVERGDAGLLGPMIYYHDRPDVIWSAGGLVSYWSGHIRHIGLRETDRGQYTGVRDVDYVTGCAVLARMKTVAEIGVLDERYLMYNEDTDWCARCLDSGHAVVAVSDARMWHKVSMSSGGGLTQYKIYNRLRSTLRFFTIHARFYHWLGIVPATAARAVAFAAAQVCSGRVGNAGAMIRALLDSMTRRKRTIRND